MMTRLLTMRGVLCLLLALLPSPSTATEDRFIYVDRLPDVRGELKRTLRAADEEKGQRTVQDLYAEDYEHAVIETYVLKTACGTDIVPKAYIVAIKYPPKKPATFAVATLHDIYKEVYVEDGSGRVRLYEDVQARNMFGLSERFKPTCLPI